MSSLLDLVDDGAVGDGLAERDGHATAAVRSTPHVSTSHRRPLVACPTSVARAKRRCTGSPSKQAENTSAGSACNVMPRLLRSVTYAALLDLPASARTVSSSPRSRA